MLFVFLYMTLKLSRSTCRLRQTHLRGSHKKLSFVLHNPVVYKVYSFLIGYFIVHQPRGPTVQ
jgi:hypothetical protein